ncbi:MAG: hypothetical protein IJS72_04070 [Oscillospiraceae bacterium]|nr:hypothetical protein [Oscillospiraceae bacterium]
MTTDYLGYYIEPEQDESLDRSVEIMTVQDNDESNDNEESDDGIILDTEASNVNSEGEEAAGEDLAYHKEDSSEEENGEICKRVYDDAGDPVLYSLNANYCLERDIQLPDGILWSLPEEYSGIFIGQESHNENNLLYDSETDTVYIHTFYQLEILFSDQREYMPLVSGDVFEQTFGIGNLVFGEDGNIVTYDKSHHYVIASDFSAEIEAASEAAPQTENLEKSFSVKSRSASDYVRSADNSALVEGRDYFGQVTMDIDGITYILIGDRQQLDAINNASETNVTKVYGPIYKVYQRRGHLGNWDAENIREQTVTLIYPGDADLIDGVWDGEGTVSFAANKMYSGNNGLLSSDAYHSLTNVLDITGYDRTFYCTVDEYGNWSADERSDPTLSYTKNGNYIVFRDIDMRVHSDEDMRGSNDVEDSPPWIPLMFSGKMYGITSPGGSVGTIRTEIVPVINGTDSTHSVAVSRRPTISFVNVVPATKTQLSEIRLNLNTQTGVGFFGTLQGEFSDSSLIARPVQVKNIRLDNCLVNNPAVSTDVNVSVVSGLLTGLGWALEIVLGPVLKVLISEDTTVDGLLTSLLNTRQKDPTSLATGAFAGRIIGDTLVEYCEVDHASVNTVQTSFEQGSAFDSTKQMIVGKGGFVGHAEGTTQYDGLSELLGNTVNVLSGVLNVIPGVGLGDLIDLLLKNSADVGKLIPTGYASPQISECSVCHTVLSDEDGKLGVGGFAGSLCGAEVSDCTVEDCNSDESENGLRINAKSFGGGFAGVARDAFIGQTLSGLGIDFGALHPQTALVRCQINNSSVFVFGESYLGGFVGTQNNSYALNCDIDINTSVTVNGSGDLIGGFTGQAHIGTSAGLGDYLQTEGSLTNTLKGLVTGVLGSGSDQSLLEIGGVAPSAIMGCQIHGPLTVQSSGGFVGGLVGRGNGAIITSSKAVYLRKLAKYNKKSNGTWREELPISDLEARENRVDQLIIIMAGEAKAMQYEGKSFAGGLAGYMMSANVGGLLGETAGIGEFLGFTVCDTYITGVSEGYEVYAEHDVAAGGIGLAVGGDVYDVELQNLSSVSAADFAGGFVGITGPGDLVSGNGLDVTLLGITLVSVNNLLSVASGIKSTFIRANVTGISDGFVVIERDQNDSGGNKVYCSGGFAAYANSVTITDCHVRELKSVHANMQDGLAAGFVGSSAAGGLAGLISEADTKLNVAQINELLGAVPYLIPKYNGCDVSFVDGGYIQGDIAGGFAADFQSGLVNTETMDGEYSGSYLKYPSGTYPDDDPEHTEFAAEAAAEVEFSVGTESEPFSVINIHHVRGGAYAGGWGGKVYSGSLASAGSGLSLLGGHGNVGTVDLAGLLSLVESYVPIIKYAGISSYDPANGNFGFSVYAAHDYDSPDSPATEGYAGGFIGYGSGVQISRSDVSRLKTGNVTPPDYLESTEAPNYMLFNNDQETEAIPYAVAGAHYAGGYIGCMDVGSAASLGGGLSLLGDIIDLSDVLKALNLIVSTIEHSHVYGAAGGFSIIASPRINLCNGTYGDSSGEGFAYAGGFAGRISGGHVQDCNVELFEYIIGEVAAGGYVGKMEPGSAANVLNSGGILNKLANVSSLASLIQDFVPTVRNSKTTCVPCGGAVRAQTPSDRSEHNGEMLRGLAGGFVGHLKGGQILGMSSATWKSENDAKNESGETVFWDIEQTRPNYTIGSYTGPKRECSAIRIRSVYGAEYAGGYCGLMECGSTAETGGLSLLGGLVDASNLISVLQVVYSQIRFGTVTGPVRDIDFDTFRIWMEYIGLHGAFAPEFAALLEEISSGAIHEGNFESELEKYIYGYNVRAGRSVYDNYALTVLSGCAGGFVGAMHSGVIEDSFGMDAKHITAMRAAGGFAGEMEAKGLANFGTVNLLGNALPLNVGSILEVGKVLVPSVARSGITGYQKGLKVEAVGYSGNRAIDSLGCAGGFVGGCYGGQIGLPDDQKDPEVRARHPNASASDGATVWVDKLLSVKGGFAAGGFVGRCSSASTLTADTSDAGNGLIQSLLNSLVAESNPGKLISFLSAVQTTIKNAAVSPSDSDWGITVDGSYNDGDGQKYANYVGGFAGLLEAAVLGERSNQNDRLVVKGLRYVSGGEYAGGFFGLADIGSVAQVGDTGGATTLLDLVQAGNIGVLDAFRTYIYHADAIGVEEGLRVFAHSCSDSGTMSTYYISGSAGGFGGAMMNGTIENSNVKNLNYAVSPQYAGGFVGYLGKNKLVNIDEAKVTNNSPLGAVLSALGLDLGANAQLLNIIGATVNSCSVYGFSGGFIIRTADIQQGIYGVVDEADVTGACAGGFAGYGDITQIDDCHVYALKKVASQQIAAGFIGRGSMSFIADVDVSSDLSGSIIQIVNLLIKALYLDKASQLNLLNLDGGILGLKVMSDGDLLYVNLLGLRIAVSLVKNDPEYEGSDAAVISIGSSTIKLPCDSNGLKGSTPDITLNLFEGNRTTVKNSGVSGVVTGYDVHGGGYEEGNDANENGIDDDDYTAGSGVWGYAGGFVGFNDNGYFSHNTMELCDVIGGAPDKVGPFVGGWRVNSRSIEYLEGNGNYYYIYRLYDPENTEASVPNGQPASGTLPGADIGNVGDVHYNRYTALHREFIQTLADLIDAREQSTGTYLNARISAAKADLMLGVIQTDNTDE